MSWSKLPLATLVLAVLVLPTRPATATPIDGAASVAPPAGASGGAPSKGPAHAVPAATKAGKDKLYEAALERYAAGDLEGALQYLLRCYEVTHSSNLLYSLAQLHAEMSHCEVALDYYQRFLVAAPEGKERARAVLQVETLRKQCPDSTSPLPPAVPAAPPASSDPPPVTAPLSSAAVAPPPATPPAKSPEPRVEPPPDVPQPSRPLATIGWVTLGTGVALAGASVYFAVKTHQAGDDVDERKRLLSQVTWERSGIDERMQDFFRNRNLTVAFGIGAGVASATGLLLVLFARPSTKTIANATSCPLSVTVTPEGGSATYRARF